KLELSHIEDRLKQIVRRRSVLGPEVESEAEIPVMFLMQSNQGLIIFSEYFDEILGERIYDEVLLSIMKVSSEMKENDKERLKNKEFTFLINNINNVYISYIFIGKSYNGIKKLNELSNIFNSNKELKKMIENAVESNESLNLEDRINLSGFINDIFIS
ncbi:MAG: hypothetical protein H7644_14745, partial [Candidatus Heimdallarchaeota archaeon]|nr:hypothetical protein [Candidatus Heimdallarchaeota archaeon]MCK5145020.1 hypothetical protein [Candidatus Heimdallarchaeota archaeon]